MANDKKSGNDIVDAIEEYNQEEEKKDKEEQKNGKSGSGSSLETYFKLFVIGSFLMGFPFAIGIFALGIACAIAKWGYNKYKQHKAKDLNDNFLKTAKEVNGELPEKDEVYQDLAKEKDNDKYLEKIQNITTKFAESQKGKELLNNPNFTNMVQQVTGVNPNQVVDMCKKNELNKAPGIQEPTEFEKKEQQTTNTREDIVSNPEPDQEPSYEAPKMESQGPSIDPSSLKDPVTEARKSYNAVERSMGSTFTISNDDITATKARFAKKLEGVPADKQKEEFQKLFQKDSEKFYKDNIEMLGVNKEKGKNVDIVKNTNDYEDYRKQLFDYCKRGNPNLEGLEYQKYGGVPEKDIQDMQLEAYEGLPENMKSEEELNKIINQEEPEIREEETVDLDYNELKQDDKEEELTEDDFEFTNENNEFQSDVDSRHTVEFAEDEPQVETQEGFQKAETVETDELEGFEEVPIGNSEEAQNEAEEIDEEETEKLNDSPQEETKAEEAPIEEGPSVEGGSGVLGGIASAAKTVCSTVKEAAKTVGSTVKEAAKASDAPKSGSNSDGKKDDKKDDKDKEKEKDSGSNLGTYFKLFAVGAFLMGTPFAIGVFAIGLLALIAKWGYNKYKEHKAKDLNNDLLKTAKEVNGELPEKDDKYQDLAKTDNMKDYVKNIGDTAVKFAESNLGKKLLANPAFNKLVEGVTGINPQQALDQYKKGELLNDQPKVEAPSDPKVDELANKIDENPAIDVTDQFQDILDEYDKDEEVIEDEQEIREEETVDLDYNELKQDDKEDELTEDDFEFTNENNEFQSDVDSRHTVEFAEDVPQEETPEGFKKAETVETDELEGFEEVPIGSSEETQNEADVIDEEETEKLNDSPQEETKAEEAPVEDSPSVEGGSGVLGGIASAAKTVGSTVKEAAKTVGSTVKEAAKNSEKKESPKSDDKSDKKDDKDKKKDDKPIDLETMFKIFVIGAFLMGTAFAVAIFAIGLAAVIGKKIYDWKKGKDKDKDGTELGPKDLTERSKEVCEQNDPNYEKNKGEYEKFMSLAFDKNGKELSPEAFKKNVEGYIREFAKTKQGQEILNNGQFKGLFKSAFGTDLEETLNKSDIEIQKEEKQDQLNREEALDERQHTQNTIASDDIKNWKEESDLDAIEEADELEEEDFDPDQQIDLEDDLEKTNEIEEHENIIDLDDAPIVEDRPYDPEQQIPINDEVDKDASLDGNFESQAKDVEGVTTDHIEIDDKEFPPEYASREDIQSEMSLDLERSKDVSKGIDSVDLQGLQDVFNNAK